ncbi:Uncharacterised protein [Mycobacterium tuberculosis]|nr:Uncharacterised protein [Mycobacterium tuberculosis]
MRQVLDFAEQVARQQNGGAVFREGADEGSHGQGDIGVEPVGRLVQQEQGGGAEQRASDVQPLLHAAGKLLKGSRRRIGEFHTG